MMRLCTILWLPFSDWGLNIIVSVNNLSVGEFIRLWMLDKCSTVNVWLGRFIQLSAAPTLCTGSRVSERLLIMLLSAAHNNNPDNRMQWKEGGGVWSQESRLFGVETPQTSFYGLGCRKDYAPWVTCDLLESAIQAAAFHRQAPVVTQFDRFLKPLSSQLVPALLLRHLLDDNCTLSHASGKDNQLQ